MVFKEGQKAPWIHGSHGTTLGLMVLGNSMGLPMDPRVLGDPIGLSMNPSVFG